MPGIIVGTDGSHHSRKALEWAAREAGLRHAPLTVLTVHQAVVGYFGGPVAYPGDVDLTAKAREAARKDTDEVLDALGDDLPRPEQVSVLAVTGLPAEEILAAADDADLVVVGSRGAGGFKQLLLGSVSSQVTHHARCPVVVVPHDAR